MSLKYIFIGLPGAGKTTVLKSICQVLPNTHLFIMDDEIKKRLNALIANPQFSEQLKENATDDSVVNFFCAKWRETFEDEIVFSALLRRNFDKHSSAIMKLLGESHWREFEAAIAADFVKTKQGCAFDLGGSQPLNPAVKKVCSEMGIKFIYLKANHEAICDHLGQVQADGLPRWQHISNYQVVGEEGWKALALKHRQDREPLLEAIADLTIDVSHLSIEQVVLDLRMLIAKNELQISAEYSEEIEKKPSPVLYRDMDQGESSEPKSNQIAQAQRLRYSPSNF